MSLDTIKILPGVGGRDIKKLASLRLARWQARKWMKENGIRDLGRTERLQRINQG